MEVESVCQTDIDYSVTEEPSQSDDVNSCNNINNVDVTQNLEILVNVEKPTAVWTNNSTSILLRLYEHKLEMLETPKKKTQIWLAISEGLKDYNIEMTPDQVRWKVNALTKKYKQCVDSGQHDKFKYFDQMDKIYDQFHVDCDSYPIAENPSKRKDNLQLSSNIGKPYRECKSVIELRKIRLANRIESDRTQGKLKLERQWLEYLRKQEAQRQWRDDIFERNLQLRSEELELRKKELEFKETLECKKIQLMEKEYNDLLRIEREKCDLLNELLINKK